MGIERRILRTARRRGIPIKTRHQWGSKHRALYQWRRINRPHLLLPKNPADTLVQHITVTFDSGELVGDFKKDMQTIERIGYDRFKTGCSYNFGWDMQTGMIGFGMPVTAKGSHTQNDKGLQGFSFDQNGVALAVAAIGMPGNKPTVQALDYLSEFIAVLIEVGALTMDHDYMPHSAFTNKDCPTEAIRKAMPYINRRAKRQARTFLREREKC